MAGMNPGFKRWLKLAKEYKRKHGHRPPKGTDLATLEKELGKKRTTKKQRASSSSSSSSSSKKRKLMWKWM